MKIYIVSENEYDWTPTLGAFTNKDKAIKLAEDLFEKVKTKWDHYKKYTWEVKYVIEEVELDGE